MTDEHARRAAREAERDIMAGRYRGPLHGLPYAPKDILATEGIRTTNGSRVTPDWVPEYFRDPGDPYAQKLIALARPREGRLTDRLLIFGFIEARSHERLELLAKNLSLSCHFSGSSRG